MFIIGISFIDEDGTLQTLLVQPSISLINVTARQIVPWFFSQAIPLFGINQGNSVAVRVKTGTDPFPHLRRAKGARFDGKGFTVQRSIRHSGVVLIDGDVKLAIEEFNLLCSGLFYGTANYPNLNLLLSQRRFRAHVADPALLWSILSDCLLCRQYNARQGTVDDFKLEMRRKYLATQLKDYRPMIEEIEKRLEETKRYDQLKKSLQQMMTTVHTRRIRMFEHEVKELQQNFRSVSEEKNQLLANRLVRDTDEIVTMEREIASINLSTTITELENIHDLFEMELAQLKTNLEVSQTAMEELSGSANEIESILSRLEAIPSLEFELENARCAIANNHSLRLFTKLSDENDRQLYITNLAIQKQSLTIDIWSVEEAIEQVANEKRETIATLQKLKDLGNASTSDSDPHLDDIMAQLQSNVNEIVKASKAIATIENAIININQKIWQDYAAINSVPFDELVSIAAVKLAAVEQLEDNTRDDFIGFVYDRALASGINTKWIEGFSHTAIFNTLESAICVQQLVEQLQSDVGFAYIIVNTRLRTSLNTFLRENVPEVPITTNYEDTVVKVNRVIQHIVDKLRSTQKLKQTRERLVYLNDIKAQLLTELDRAGSEHELQRPRTNIPDLPDLMKRFIKSKNHKLRLQAHCESLENFIRQLETGVARLPTEEQLNADEIRLTEELKTGLKNAAQNRKLLYDGVRQLTEAYNKLQFAIDRSNDHAWTMETPGLSPPAAKKLLDCWTTCCESIRRGTIGVKELQNKLKPAEENLTSRQANELNEQIQSLKLREKTIADRITSTTDMLAEYWQENNVMHEQTGNQMDSVSDEELMNKIVSIQSRLHQMPPGCKSAEVAKMKTRLKHLQLLESIRLNAREMCLNNLILPVIEKLHVQKLRQMCQLVECISVELPELGGIIKVSFGYASNDRAEKSFKLEDIRTVNIHIINDAGNEVRANKKQLQLAYLILFLCFLYCDNCKLVLLDKSFEKLLDSGIVGLFHVLENFFPSMQFIVLDNST